MSNPRLSILIATTVDRRPLFEELMEVFDHQIKGYPIEILSYEDNKEISIGKKRQKLLEAASGDYIVFLDSDDMPYPEYTPEIMKALESGPDCVGFLIHMTTNGSKPQTCCHSLRYPVWKEHIDGHDYVRNVTHFNPVKRSLALNAGFPDLRFSEDKWYSDRVTSICKTEVFINKRLFHYRYSTVIKHEEKYGII